MRVRVEGLPMRVAFCILAQTFGITVQSNVMVGHGRNALGNNLCHQASLLNKYHKIFTLFASISPSVDENYGSELIYVYVLCDLGYVSPQENPHKASEIKQKCTDTIHCTI